MKKSKQFKAGDKVFAKVKGYPPWPAKVTAVNGKKYTVEFYGTGEIGSIKVEDLFYYLKHKSNLIKPSKRKDYNDALEQIEAAVNKEGTDGNEYPEDSLTDVSVSSTASEKRGAKRKRSSSEKSDSNLSTKATAQRKASADSETAASDDSVIVTSVEKPAGETPRDPFKAPPGTITGNEEVPAKFVEVEFGDQIMHPEEEEGPSPPPPPPPKKKYSIITKLLSEYDLKSFIAYGEHVKEYDTVYQAKPEEPRQDYPNHAFAVKLPDDRYVALKFHQKFPQIFKNEYERALYDAKEAKRLLDLKEEVQSGKLKPEDKPSLFVATFKMSEKDIEVALETDVLKLYKARTERLRLEGKLVDLDASIKNCLGLDRADPEEALEHLKLMNKVVFDKVVLVKHPHIVEMVRRLRKYVGNTDEWNMSAESLETFQSNADRVRGVAESIWEKFKNIITIPENSPSFWDGYNEVVNEFRQQTKNLTEDQVVIVNAFPYTRQHFMELYDDKNRPHNEVFEQQKKIASLKPEELNTNTGIRIPTVGPSV